MGQEKEIKRSELVARLTGLGYTLHSISKGGRRKETTVSIYINGEAPEGLRTIPIVEQELQHGVKFGTFKQIHPSALLREIQEAQCPTTTLLQVPNVQ